MFNNKTTLFQQFTSVLILGLIIRAFVFFSLDQDEIHLYFDSTANSKDSKLYNEALIEHFWEYIFFNHTILPITIFRDWFNHNFINPNFFGLSNFIIISILSSLSSGFVHLTLKNLELPTWLSFSSALILSIKFINWDLQLDVWEGGYTILNPFLIVIFSWSVTNLILQKNLRSSLVCGLSASILIISLEFSLLIVFPSLIASVVAWRTFKHHRALLVAFILPFSFAMILILKNIYHFGVYAPTTGAGQNIIQNLSLSVIDPYSGELIDFATDLNYPPWWLWCYKEAKRRNSGRAAPHAAAFYGACESGEAERWDYTDLKDYIKKEGPNELMKIIQKDEEIIKLRPWLFSGLNFGRQTHFKVAYGKVSSKLLLDVVHAHPYGYLVRLYTNLKYFILNGSNFEDAREINHDLTAHALKFKALNFFQQTFVPLIRLAMILSYVFATFIPIQMILFYIFRRTFLYTSIEMRMIWLISLGFSFGTFGSIGFHCCENYRHGFYFLGSVWVIATYSLFWITNILQKTLRKFL